MAYITNCVVWRWYNYLKNSISTQPYAVYKNNYLGILMRGALSLSIDSGSEFYNNRFFSTPESSTIEKLFLEFIPGCVNEENYKAAYLPTEKLNEYPAHPTYKTVGSDGTPIGPYGGTGFSEYPAIPRITSKSIDANSDAEGKINVKITVKAE